MFRSIAALFVTMLAAVPGAQSQAPAVPARATKPAPAASSAIVNLNTATATELAELPGVGPKTAARIVEYRLKKGPFKKIEELMNVQGIGEKSFLRLKAQITVSGKADQPSSQQD